ncbi:periplasmic nitrate reductase, electron transfer subunit [bacterium MnTg02]|nr:periplasmic nitrate reductase, electron transfer subunit [bacterium MnTg02]
MRRQNYTSLMRAARIALLPMVLAIGTGLPSAALAGDPIATLRNWVINKEPTPPPIPKINNTDLRQGRSYPEQPPVIPHTTRNYQIDLNFNKCLTCHSRKATERSQAPMVSVTHFMDRDGQVLTSVSPRRFFCTQCHVTQAEVSPLTGNDFIDVDSLIAGTGKKKRN